MKDKNNESNNDTLISSVDQTITDKNIAGKNIKDQTIKDQTTPQEPNPLPDDTEKMFKIGMLGVGVAGLFVGYAGGTKKAASNDPKAYQEALQKEHIHKFARRALVRGSQYAVGGFTIFCTVVWLGLGRPTLNEFTHKMQHTLPNPKNSNLEEWQLSSKVKKDDDVGKGE